MKENERCANQVCGLGAPTVARQVKNPTSIHEDVGAATVAQQVKNPTSIHEDVGSISRSVG